MQEQLEDIFYHFYILNHKSYRLSNQLSTKLVLILILISSVSQFGDLTVSFLRKSKIKIQET